MNHLMWGEKKRGMKRRGKKENKPTFYDSILMIWIIGRKKGIDDKRISTKVLKYRLHFSLHFFSLGIKKRKSHEEFPEDDFLLHPQAFSGTQKEEKSERYDFLECCDSLNLNNSFWSFLVAWWWWGGFESLFLEIRSHLPHKSTMDQKRKLFQNSFSQF